MERGRVGEKYIVGKENVNFREFFRILAEVSGRRPPRVPVPSTLAKISARILEKMMDNPPLDYNSAIISADFWYYDPSRAQKELGLRGRPLQDTLTDAIRWFQENGYI
jgi:dihydroflavonol-4-reductase